MENIPTWPTCEGLQAGKKESRQNEDLTPLPRSLLVEKPEFYLREDGLEGPLVHHPRSASFPDSIANSLLNNSSLDLLPCRALNFTWTPLQGSRSGWWSTTFFM